MPPIQTQPQAMAADTPQTSTSSVKRIFALGMLGALAVLVCYSVYLAQYRIFQVDECQALYMAKVLATGQSAQFFTDASLFLLGPLAWITTHLHESAQMFDVARLLFLAIFWLNILLMAAIAAGRLFSFRGLVALVAAASLAPFWDYGFEIRHDNLILTGLLVIWWTVHVKKWGLPAYLLAGAITAACLFIAVKSVVYFIPLSFAIVALPLSGSPPWWKTAAAWIAGAVLAVILVRLAYGSSGGWDIYLSVFHQVSKYSSGNGGSGKFPPWSTLERLLNQTPLLLAVSIAGLIAVGADLLRRRKAAFTWDGVLPEAVLLLGTFGALIINPTPFAYNLVNLVPFALIFAFRYVAELGKSLQLSRELWINVAAILIFLHLAPFAISTCRHVYYRNTRQVQLMYLAEQMTDPVKDPVYDAIGMVPTRQSVDFHWYLHSLAAALITTPGSRVRDILAARPAPIFIPSYRTDWLPEADHKFIDSRYVRLADDFEVLGSVLPPGGGTLEIFHPGRYCIISAGALPGQPRDADAIDKGGPVTGTLDGASLSTQPIELSTGTHRLETSPNRRLAVVWVGPTLTGVPLLSPGDHRFLFFNWY